jgi:hypothetical protein
MLSFGGKIFKIDINKIDEIIRVNNPEISEEIEEKIITDKDGNTVTETTKTTMPRSREIDAAKYESIRGFLEVVLIYNEEVDDALGIDRAFLEAPMSFKLAFNTLLDYDIIVEVE